METTMWLCLFGLAMVGIFILSWWAISVTSRNTVLFRQLAASENRIDAMEFTAKKNAEDQYRPCCAPSTPAPPPPPAIPPVVERLLDLLTTTCHRQDQQLRFFGDRMLAVSEQASEMIRLERDAPTPPRRPSPPPADTAFFPPMDDGRQTLDTVTDPVAASYNNQG